MENKALKWYVPVSFIVALSFFPIVRLIIFLATTGDNNISMDNWATALLIDKVLSGQYHFKNIFHDTLQTGHSLFFPFLIQSLVARFFHWNTFLILFSGIVFTIINLVLLFDMSTRRIASPWRLLCLPILSGLLFSATQISIFEFEFTTIQYHLNQFGVLLGTWALTSLNARKVGVFLMALGGVIASWSYGGGPLIFIPFLIGLLILGYRSFYPYMMWAFGALAAFFPYLYYRADRLPEISGGEISKSNIFFILKVLGSAFFPTNQPTHQFFAGISGALFFVLFLGIILSQNGSAIKRIYLPQFILVCYGLLHIAQISVFRKVMVPWYSFAGMYFWIGLIGIWFILLFNTKENIGKIYFRFFSFFLFFPFLLFSLIFSNLDYLNHSAFLQTRAPASASCLRNFDTAPTYCEDRVFWWPSNHYGPFVTLGEILKKHNLSVFSPNQTWTLQGDFILESVKTFENPNAPDVYWTAELASLSQVSWTDFRHLNLFLHPPNSIEWTVQLPRGLSKASFHSAIGISPKVPKTAKADGVLFKVEIIPEGKSSRAGFLHYLKPNAKGWLPFEVPLTDFAGQTITIKLSTEPWGNSSFDWALYRFPYIDLRIASFDSSGKIDLRPSNTDISPDYVKRNEKDFIFDIHFLESWLLKEVILTEETAEKSTLYVTTNSRMETTFEQAICLADYSHFYIREAIALEMERPYLNVEFFLDKERKIKRDFSIALFNDARIHEYSFNLKLLELSLQSRLWGLRLQPYLSDSPVENGKVEVSDIRLISKVGPSQCH